jgi:ankyrin repeat protein
METKINFNYNNFDEKFILLSNKNIFRKKHKKKTTIKYNFNKQKSYKINLINNQNVNKILRNSLTFSIQNFKSEIPQETFSNLIELLTKNKDNYFINLFDKLSNIYNLNTLTMEGNSLLNLSCQLNNIIISKYLLKKGLNPNLRNYFGNYPLHYAIGHKNFELINELIKFGAKEDVYNKQGLTPWDILQNFYK